MINAKDAKELSNGVKRFAFVLDTELEKLDACIKKSAERGDLTAYTVYYTYRI